MDQGVYAIIGSTLTGVVTLIGIHWSNQATASRLERQFSHDRTEREIDRLLKVKQEVYLGVAETVGAAITGLSSHANLSLPDMEVLTDYRRNVGKLARMHVVSQPDTAKALIAFTNQLSRSIAELATKRSKAQAIKFQLDDFQQQIPRLEAKKSEIVEAMTQGNIAGSMDERKMAMLTKTFEFYSGQQEKMHAQVKVLAPVLNTQRYELMMLANREVLKCQALLVPFLINVRSELRDKVDLKAYEEALQAVSMPKDALAKLYGIEESATEAQFISEQPSTF